MIEHLEARRPRAFDWPLIGLLVVLIQLGRLCSQGGVGARC